MPGEHPALPGAKGGLLFANPASKKRERLTVRFSSDDGKTWPTARVLHDGPAAYSCLTMLPDGSIGCLYECGDKTPYETVTFARMTRQWLRGADEKPEKETAELIFTLKRWEGEYFSKDVPGGVQTTPVVGSVHAVKADGTGLRKVAALGKNTDVSCCSPDGRWIYFQSNAAGRWRVHRCRADGSGVACLTEGEPLGKGWKDAFGAALSGDGQKLLYTVHDGQTGRLVLAHADGSEPRFVAPELGYTYMGALSPTGDRAVFSGPARGYRLLLVKLPDGKASVLTPDQPESFVPRFTPDGKTIVFCRRDGDIYRVDADGGNPRRLTEGNKYVEFRLSSQDRHGSTDGPDVSPDGKSIAYIAVKDGVPNLCVMDVDGRGQRQLTHRKTPCGRPRWSPDGRQLAFVSFEGQFPQLFVVKASGGEPVQLTRLDGAVTAVQWRH